MPTPYAATVPAWISQVSLLPPGIFGARASELFDGMETCRAVYGCPPDAQFTAFVYLYRRFGPPFIGGDPSKDVATYVLTTSHSEIWLTLGLSGSPLPYAVGYLCAAALHKQLSLACRSSDAPYELVTRTIMLALKELLRPVFINDVAINILGRIPDDELDDRDCAERSPYAGLGVPREALDALLDEEEDA